MGHSVSGSQSATTSMDEEDGMAMTSFIRNCDEFDVYTQCLPNKLDLSDIVGINFLFKQQHHNVSDSVLHNAKERIKREKRQLDEEYDQYLADQTEMLLLKLSKHRQNEKKCVTETNCTQNKLAQKLDQQRNKFQCIVNDQLQILQLTQELNDDAVVVCNEEEN